MNIDWEQGIPVELVSYYSEETLVDVFSMKARGSIQKTHRDLRETAESLLSGTEKQFILDKLIQVSTADLLGDPREVNLTSPGPRVLKPMAFRNIFDTQVNHQLLKEEVVKAHRKTLEDDLDFLDGELKNDLGTTLQLLREIIGVSQKELRKFRQNTREVIKGTSDKFQEDLRQLEKQQEALLREICRSNYYLEPAERKKVDRDHQRCQEKYEEVMSTYLRFMNQFVEEGLLSLQELREHLDVHPQVEVIKVSPTFEPEKPGLLSWQKIVQFVKSLKKPVERTVSVAEKKPSLTDLVFGVTQAADLFCVNHRERLRRYLAGTVSVLGNRADLPTECLQMLTTEKIKEMLENLKITEDSSPAELQVIRWRLSVLRRLRALGQRKTDETEDPGSDWWFTLPAEEILADQERKRRYADICLDFLEFDLLVDSCANLHHEYCDATVQVTQVSLDRLHHQILRWWGETVKKAQELEIKMQEGLSQRLAALKKTMETRVQTLDQDYHQTLLRIQQYQVNNPTEFQIYFHDIQEVLSNVTCFMNLSTMSTLLAESEIDSRLF